MIMIITWAGTESRVSGLARLRQPWVQLVISAVLTRAWTLSWCCLITSAPVSFLFPGVAPVPVCACVVWLCFCLIKSWRASSGGAASISNFRFLFWPACEYFLTAWCRIGKLENFFRECSSFPAINETTGEGSRHKGLPLESSNWKTTNNQSMIMRYSCSFISFSRFVKRAHGHY